MMPLENLTASFQCDCERWFIVSPKAGTIKRVRCECGQRWKVTGFGGGDFSLERVASKQAKGA